MTVSGFGGKDLRSNGLAVVLAVLVSLASGPHLLAVSEENSDQEDAVVPVSPDEAELEDSEARSAAEVPDEPATGTSKAGYVDTVPAHGGSKSVGVELVDNDRRKYALFDVDFIHQWLPDFYRFKRSVNDRSGLSFNLDYSLLMQRASFSFTERDAASSVFRMYGNWRVFGDKETTSGNVVVKFEHRGSIWGDQTPRDLGFNTGSALSTANYKDSGWGFTDFYWKQRFLGGRSGILIGHMDPGDWADQHVLLNAWTSLLSDAFYNNPSEAIPRRTFSAVGRLQLPNRWYASGGIHDANGKDNDIDFQQVWETPELFTWVEIGFRPKGFTSFGQTTHLHFWHQDERVEAGVEESWGVTFSDSHIFDNGVTTVIRAGYSEGDAPQMRRYLGFATAFPIRNRDRLLFGVGWGSPPDKSLEDQTTFEVLYRLHLTQNTTVSPNLQITFNPSYNDERDEVFIVGLRARVVF